MRLALAFTCYAIALALIWSAFQIAPAMTWPSTAAELSAASCLIAGVLLKLAGHLLLGIEANQSRRHS